jgi:hypothetical protein
MNIRLAQNEDLHVIVEFNRAMALETEGKNLVLEVITKGVANLLAQPQRGFRLYVEREIATAQKTYASLGLQETHYNIFESLKLGIRFLEQKELQTFSS